MPAVLQWRPRPFTAVNIYRPISLPRGANLSIGDTTAVERALKRSWSSTPRNTRQHCALPAGRSEGGPRSPARAGSKQ